MRILAIVFLATACLPAFAADPISIIWIELDEHALQEKCSAVVSKSRMPTGSKTLFTKPRSTSFNGCAEIGGNACTIYTRKATENNLLTDHYQRTVGHEVIHCFKGAFHH